MVNNIINARRMWMLKAIFLFTLSISVNKVIQLLVAKRIRISVMLLVETARK